MTSKYKYVHYSNSYISESKPYRATIAGEFRCYYKTEREAAMAIDLHLISKGKNPVNILKSTK